jgi:hypothetical protein
MRLSLSNVIVTFVCLGVRRLSRGGPWLSLFTVSNRMFLRAWSHSRVISSPNPCPIFLSFEALIVGMWYGTSVFLGLAMYIKRKVGDEG